MSESSALREYGLVLVHKWRVIVACTVVGALLGILLALVLPKQYSATSTVALNPTPGDVGPVVGGRTTGQINLDTEAQIVKSGEVMTLLAEGLGREQDVKALARSVEVTVPANTSIMNVTFMDSDPETAQKGSILTAESYLKNRRAVSETTGKFVTDGYRASVATLDKEIAKAKDAAARAKLEQTRAQLIGQVAVIDAERASPGRIVTKAQLPGSPTSPNPTVIVLTFGFLGLAAGVFWAFVGDRISGLVRERRTGAKQRSDGDSAATSAGTEAADAAVDVSAGSDDSDMAAAGSRQ